MHRSILRKVRQSTIGGVGLLMAATMVACGSDGASPSQSSDGTFTMRTTVVPGTGSLPFQVAIERGIFEKHGLKMQVTQGIDIQSYIAALDRQFDAVMVNSLVAYSVATSGLPVRFYGGMQAVGDGTVQPIVSLDPKITSLKDLAATNGTLAVPRVSDQLSGVLTYSLQGTGYDVKDIKIVTVPLPDQADQLKSGGVDAALSAPGFFEPLVAEGGGKIIYDLPATALKQAGAKPPLAWVNFVSSPTFVADHPKQVQAFHDSLAEAETWIEAHPDEATAIFAKWVGQDLAVAKKSQIPPYKVDLAPADFEPWAKIFDFAKLTDKPVDLDKIVVTGL